MKKKDNITKKGYTIIETMIAVSLFLIIVMAGMGALLNANLLHQKSRDVRSILDNLSFIMEDMSRNLRTGTSYHCLITGEDVIPTTTLSSPKSCANGWGIAFELAKGDTANPNDQWVYFIGKNGIDNKLRIFKSTVGPSSLPNFIQLTPDEVTIDLVNGFSVLGAEPVLGDTLQPFVTIRLVGRITYNNLDTPFSIQTSVSQRLIDIK